MTSKRKRILGAVGALVVIGAVVGFSVTKEGVYRFKLWDI
jgi:hypothetical protein